MFSSSRSIIAVLTLSTIIVGTPPLAGSENWSDFFRDLFGIADYETIIRDETILTERLNRKDLVILGKLAAKNKVIDALAQKKISFPEAAACFYFIQKENAETLEIFDRNFKHLPKQTQSSINLLQWANSTLVKTQFEEYESFKLEVENAECEGCSIVLPMPPPHLTVELAN